MYISNLQLRLWNNIIWREKVVGERFTSSIQDYYYTERDLFLLQNSSANPDAVMRFVGKKYNCDNFESRRERERG